MKQLPRNLVFHGILPVICAVLLIPSISLGRDNSVLTVYTVNYPLAYFAGRIAGKFAEVVFPAPPDVDPAYWKPGIEDISAFQQADLILLNGAGYAKWVPKATLPRSRMVDTSKAFADQYIRVEDVLTHSHGAEGEHAHEDIAFTTWLDFYLAVGQARAITDAMVKKLPGRERFFEKNFADLERDLLALDREMVQAVSENQSEALIGSHPVYDYLIRRYGLNMLTVHWEPDEAPSRKQWSELENMLAEHPARWMVWEGEPMGSVVADLEERGVRSIVYDPCGNVPDEGDFMDVMHRNVENIRDALKP
jgi:zinc transport system substrate-binding protein